jgi:chaperonin GroES
MEPPTQTASGLLLPTSEVEKPQQGEIIAVGTGKLNKDGSRSAMSVSIGDIVLFGKYHSGEKITLNGTDYLIMKENELLAKIN